VPLEALEPADATVLAVAHPELVAAETLRRSVKGNGVLVDVKSAVAPSEWPGVRYWAL
jgi:hypothetical protein